MPVAVYSMVFVCELHCRRVFRWFVTTDPNTPFVFFISLLGERRKWYCAHGNYDILLVAHDILYPFIWRNDCGEKQCLVFWSCCGYSIDKQLTNVTMLKTDHWPPDINLREVVEKGSNELGAIITCCLQLFVIFNCILIVNDNVCVFKDSGENMYPVTDEVPV